MFVAISERQFPMSIELLTQVWKYAEVTGSELLVLLALADYAHDDGTSIYPSVATIARKSRLSVDQARRVVHELIKDGYVELVEEGGWNGKTNRPNQYRILLEKLEGGYLQDARGGTRKLQGGVLAPTRDDPLVNHQLEKAELHQPIFPPQQAQEKSSDPTALQSSDVIDYYRVNIVGKKSLLPAQEEQVFHLCLKFGNLILLEAMKQAVNGNSKAGIPTLNFIGAIAKRLYDQEQADKLRHAAIARLEGDDQESPKDFYLEDDGLEQYRKLLRQPQEPGEKTDE
jgi:hypothetical protein